MARDRDVAAFGGRTQRHDEGRLGELHHLIAGRGGAGSDLRASTQAILDVGCGTGYRRENCCGGHRELGLQLPHRPRSVLKHAQVSPAAAPATSPIGSVLLAAALEGSLTLEKTWPGWQRWPGICVAPLTAWAAMNG